MKSPLLASMQETIKLVKAGQWGEATQSLQRALGTKTTARSQTEQSATPDETPPSESPSNLGALGSLFKAFQDSFKPVPPPPIPSQAQFITKTFSNEYGSRDYKLYIPSSYKTKALPLVVMLHGCTQSSDDFANGTQMNALAEQYQLLIAYPEQSAQANVQRCWNWFKPQDQTHNQGEPSLIAGITQAIMADYRVDKKRVYIAGISAGGAMSAIMAALYPDLYSAVGIHSGLAFGSAQSFSSALMAMNLGIKPIHQPSHFVPLIIFQGDQDKTVAARNADILFEQAKTLYQQQHENASFKLCTQEHSPTDSHPYTCTIIENSQGIHEIEYWKIHGAGHAWSGGDSSGSYTDPKGPDASQEIVRFFLRHALAK
ncbi:extracellular catalytic domain type 1 short-chain-length polyhydroxyalkanoate depolymerase [Thiofilum flexile]|uniref:extracellular catalytic domain type 1 short-chain-length polyhydroxyalkanoate depolymerase n=1 Tax=Thiofilum flexile TaxID=125627 RepID=UPI00037680D5|nr:PHB depolymerase family esterase [Thiofilum flexile]